MNNVTVSYYTSQGWMSLSLSTFKFSAGELQVRLEATSPAPAYRIHATLFSSDALMQLLLVTDAIRRIAPAARIELIAPYFPYARQDRVCADGEAFSARMMCDLINAQQYSKVEIWDAHSPVVPALLDRVVDVPTWWFAKEVVRIAKAPGVVRVSKTSPILIAPDAGAEKKVQALAERENLMMFGARKVRDPETGVLSSVVIDGDSLTSYTTVHPITPLLIVDDICDGGRSFIQLAKVLRTQVPNPIWLYVTHGIMSQGFEVFEGLIDRIFVANPAPWLADEPAHLNRYTYVIAGDFTS